MQKRCIAKTLNVHNPNERMMQNVVVLMSLTAVNPSHGRTTTCICRQQYHGQNMHKCVSMIFLYACLQYSKSSKGAPSINE